MNKNNIIILLTILTLGVFYSFMSVDNKKSNEDFLILGTHPNYIPYEGIDMSGEVVGFDIDLANAIASALGKTLKVEQGQFDSLILGVQQEKFDIIMSGISITPSRLQEIDMIPYYGETVTELALVFWEKIPKNIKNLSDIAASFNPVVAVQQGTWQEIFLNKSPGITVRTLEGNSELIMDLKYGKSSAIILEKHIAKALTQKFSELKTILIPLSEDMHIYGTGIGVKKTNHILQNKIEEAIYELKINGVIDELESKWFGEG